MKVENKVADMIIGLVREAMEGELDDVSNGDVQGICEALAMKIVAEVKRAA